MRTFSSIYAFNASRYGLRAATCITNGAQGDGSGEDMLGRRKQAAKIRSLEEFKEDNQTRIRRVDRWINDCQNPGNRDAHTQFIFYWIAFDAMVSDNVSFTQSKMLQFLGGIVQLDNRETVPRALRDCQEEIGKILKLRYTMQTFWTELSYPQKELAKTRHFKKLGLGNSKTQAKNPDEWEKEFEHARKAGETALQGVLDGHGGKENVANALKSLFERLYTVRLQIFHGGSSRKNSQGRTQVEAGAKVLNKFVPCFARIMKQHKDKDWGKVPFPRCNASDPPPWLK